MQSEIRDLRGKTLRCRGWRQEAALRMLMNSLDPEVSERRQDLVVCGGAGKAARDWPGFQAIVRELESLAGDETLLVQAGRPAAVFRTHDEAPRVLIANANLVGRWSTSEHFHALEKLGLTMYGQVSAGGWLSIGAQGILPGAYETLRAVARKHFGGTLAGKLIVCGGLGGLGGAQPLAAAMNGAAFLGIEADPERIKRRVRGGYCDIMVNQLDEAVRILRNAVHRKLPVSVGLVGNCAEVLPEMMRRGIVPDVLTDQTSAHDPLDGYIPAGCTPEQAAELRRANPAEYLERSLDSIAAHVQAMLDLRGLGAVVFDSGNNIRRVAADRGVAGAFTIPGFVSEYLRPLLCEGRGPLQWVALSGEPGDIAAADAALGRLFPADEALVRWIGLVREKVRFQGLPARAGWLGHGERAEFALDVNRMVASGELKAPVVFGRDHLDAGAAASPYGETERMPDASDAVADWPVLNALLNTAAGASWVWLQSGGGLGIGYSLQAGQAAVAEGTDASARRLERVMSCDAGLGILRQADAGCQEAIRFAERAALRRPQL